MLGAHPPPEGEGRRERSERRGGVGDSWKITPPRLAAAVRADPPPPGKGNSAGGASVAHYFVFAAPTCWSQMRNASTIGLESRGCACGNLAIQPAYSSRPYSLITSWLSFGAIETGTFFTAGPG